MLRQLVGPDVDRHRRIATGREPLERAGEATLGERHGMQPAREVAKLGMGLAQLVVGQAQDAGGLMVVAELAPSDLEQIPNGQETLLRAVMQVAADTPAPRVGGFDERARERRRAAAC